MFIVLITKSYDKSVWCNFSVHCRIENAWSVFKRTMKGTYIHVSKKYLQRYVDEFVFRFNTRKISKYERIELLLQYAAA